jgi:hypothetical protein
MPNDSCAPCHKLAKDYETINKIKAKITNHTRKILFSTNQKRQNKNRSTTSS